MKIKLPHRTLRLTEEDKFLPCEDKITLVNKVLQEKVDYAGKKITLEEYLEATFNNKTSIVIMDMLAYFITKIHRTKQDIMTRETVGKMNKGDGRTVNMSSLQYRQKVSMGIDDINDYGELR